MENGSLLWRNTGVSNRQSAATAVCWQHMSWSLTTTLNYDSGCLHGNNYDWGTFLFLLSDARSGGSHSDCVILNEKGETVGASSGGGTNPWVSGVCQLAAWVKCTRCGVGQLAAWVKCTRCGVGQLAAWVKCTACRAGQVYQV